MSGFGNEVNRSLDKLAFVFGVFMEFVEIIRQSWQIFMVEPDDSKVRKGCFARRQ